jgi:hypothetical protein
MVEATSPSTAVEIRAVTTPQEAEQFLDLPKRVYANDPNWVPPIRSSIVSQFAPDNPFFAHGQLQRFIAVRSGEVVGRIVAAVNDRLIEREGKRVGLFGFFECIEEFAVAKALLDAACQWLREQGMELARGPIIFRRTIAVCFWWMDLIRRR